MKRDGIGLVAISVDEHADSVDLAARYSIAFPLLRDPGADVAASYGVKMEGEVLAVPATFVLRPDRTIAWKYVGETQFDRPAREELRRQAEAAR